MMCLPWESGNICSIIISCDRGGEIVLILLSVLSSVSETPTDSKLQKCSKSNSLWPEMVTIKTLTVVD